MRRLIIVIIAIVALAAGCVRGGKAVDKPTLTQDEAVARIEQLIHDTANALTPMPRLDLYRPSLNVGSCLDPTDGGSEDRVVISRTYFLRDIPKDKITNVAKQVKAYWEQQGHLIQGVSETGTVISGRSRPDDFLLSVDHSDNDVLALGATSPCIWLNGTPEPSPHAS
ncbi:hypothetical protein [Sphaerisporangium perillae]|uniref:hypothetical protein n=1 Tax=Sphaerisporangium perillae TaxID=2935860 RepID=UPI0020101894|nr:hypothetical protein [Sphaerisporangium perillae]